MSAPARERCDVAILGGGPAGCAAAIGLRARFPELSVTLVEGSWYDRPRLGEVLPGVARSLLEQLGVLEAFEEERFAPAHASAAAWGSPAPVENHFVFSAQGHGWHLDRARFDAMLARQAELRGARVLLGTRLSESGGAPGEWQLKLEGGTGIEARLVVDATGRKAVFARSRGASYRSVDRLAGFARFTRSPAGSDPRTLVEAFADGWWYTAPLPGGARVVTCMTDVDIGRGLGLPDTEAWDWLFEQTAWIRRAAGSAFGSVPCLVRAADSKVLAPMTGPGWLATGDSAMAFDPLSSQGITKALRSGVLASYAAGDCLSKGDTASPLERYTAIHEREYGGYLRAYERYFAEERRFLTREFWRRRHLRATRSATAPPPG